MPNLDNKALEYLNYIKDGTQRMSNLISQILLYSRLENVEEIYLKTDLNTLIQEILKDLKMLIGDKNVKFEINLPQEKIKDIAHY